VHRDALDRPAAGRGGGWSAAAPALGGERRREGDDERDRTRDDVFHIERILSLKIWID
jgi:hypothetical protein